MNNNNNTPAAVLQYLEAKGRELNTILTFLGEGTEADGIREQIAIMQDLLEESPRRAEKMVEFYAFYEIG